MKYFNRIDNLEELKTEYRRLALENHPDKGGKTETMQEINTDFELMFRILKKKAPHTVTETATEYRKTFYTENGWAGSRYNPNITLKEIASITRGYVKDVYPTYKFSVTTEYYSGGCSLYVCLMESPENIFDADRVIETAKSRNHFQTIEESISVYQKNITSGYLQGWERYYEAMTDKAREALKDVEALVESYNYDDSDSQYDHFDVNFYSHFYIGKWDKPLKIVSKTERIQTNKGPKKARRISA